MTARAPGRAARPTRAEQRAERRGAIVDAAVRVIATSGLPALTHRAVAREAKVPLAATTYYFASTDPERRAQLAVAGMNGLLMDRIRGIGDNPAGTLQRRLGELFTLLVGR